MLTPLDDYLCHQTVDAIEYPHTSDLRFYSRFFITFYSSEGDVAGITGIACYPNNEVMDGFALVLTDDNRQRNLRASRRLAHDPERMAVGPLQVEVVDPLHKFRIVCGENAMGFSYDIVCETLARPMERRPRYRGRVNGRVVENTWHFNQGYSCSGSITVDGRRHTVRPDRWFGVKDHSWGTGRFWDGPYTWGPAVKTHVSDASFPAGGAKPTEKVAQSSPGHYEAYNVWAPFASGADPCYLAFSMRPPDLASITAGQLHYPWGDARPMVKLAGIERKNLVLDERRKVFKSCDVLIVGERGEEIPISVRGLCTLYERGGGYGDIGTGYRMGKPMGELHVEGEEWHTDDPAFPKWPLLAHVSEMRWGDRLAYGIFEANDDWLLEVPYHKFTPATYAVEPR